MPSLGLLNRHARNQWVRLHTLVLLRWIAVIGQLVAVAAATRIFGIALDLGLIYLVIATAVIANLVALLFIAPTRRLTEPEAMLVLLFDLTQLSVLLALSGGINNPFALLVIAPVTISATALELRSTLLIGVASILSVTLLAFFHVPLRMADTTVLEMPELFRFGYWTAIVIGVVFIGAYSRRVAGEIHQLSDALLATQSTLAREQTLADLSGIVAAAAHELGTPLATIKLVSTELASELEADRELRDDALLIGSQVDRCRDILRTMDGSATDDLILRQAPLEAVLREAAEPHVARGKTVEFDCFPARNGAMREPQILRRPEIIHGLRNLVQNAVDFARSSVWIEASWSETSIMIRIMDDGPGFPLSLLGRIGDPYIRLRDSLGAPPARPGYEGMGLGLFIAKTLLERTGAELSFANASTRAGRPKPDLVMPEERPIGAIVEIDWPRERVAGEPPASAAE